MKYRFIIVYVFLFQLLPGCLFADEYKIVVRAHHGIKASIRQWQATVDELNKKIPRHHFTLVPIRSLDLITLAAGSGDIDFILTNPSSFVEIEHLHNAKALATLNNKRGETAQARFGSVIFSKMSTKNITKLDDIKGKSLIAVSKNAFGGWRVAWLELLENGIDPFRDLKNVSYAIGKTQPEVIWSVVYGKADVGVVRTDLLEGMIERGDIQRKDFRILNQKKVKDFPFVLSTKLYPEWAFSVMKHVPADIGQQVKNVLSNITEKQKAAIAGRYSGWIEPSDYTAVHELMQRLKVGTFKHHH